ncbi:aspartate/glutamate racemase family protein [Asaia sp. As-1742]|uniref:aspartate/glutamate racemase family protein n=1 Tax=Asaia sp. As-1742 TaxID=2608325 RepID=UPI00141F40D2|nr:aspartate/glutamate racemase family protein [Asaia sp. As-1742]NIE80261.1 aspartate/glutamate racemase family protein [Asaia sp. As-1742]
MRMIGLLGGMSWESSAMYYRLLNEGVRDRLGPASSARCLLWSFDFAEIKDLQHRGAWDVLTERLIEAARHLEKAGADDLVICTNTMHCVADAVQAQLSIPILHIADATGEQIRQSGFRRIGLLGTRFTMEQDFYRKRLTERYGLEVIIPDERDRMDVHRIIYDELVAGQISPSSRALYRAIMARLVASGAEAIILGCTEIMLLVGAEDCTVPLFDTTALHVQATLEKALAD